MADPYFDEGGVTIYHGDAADILPTLERVALVATDPPYGVDLKYEGEYDDDRTVWLRWFEETWPVVVNAGDRVFVTPGIRNLWVYPPAQWVLCWVKSNSMRRNDTGGFNQWEPILLYGKRRIWQDTFTKSYTRRNDTGGHPCPKPLELFRWLVNIGCDEGDTVLDPFMGSGTTLRAAKDCGRRAIGIEVEEQFCEAAAKRLAQEAFTFDEPTTRPVVDVAPLWEEAS